MAKKKKVITTRLDQDLVESAQKRVADWLDKVGAGRSVSPREAVEYALAAFLPENSAKRERRIAADEAARTFVTLVGMTQRHELPLEFMINSSGTSLWVRFSKGSYHCLASGDDPAALREALVARGVHVLEDGIVVHGDSGHPVRIERDLSGFDELPFPDGIAPPSNNPDALEPEG